MPHAFIDTAIWTLGFSGELVLISVLIFCRYSQDFPLFTAYITFAVFRDILLFPIYNHCSPHTYFIAYWSSGIPDYLLQFGILYEITKNIFSSNQKRIPDWATYRLWILLLLSILTTAVIIANTKFTDHKWINNFVDSVDLTLTILRTLLFISIVAISGISRTPWKSPVQKIATGLAIFSIIDLAVSYGYVIYHALWLDYYHRIAYLISLGYWIVSLTLWPQFFVLAAALLLAGMKGWQKLDHRHDTSWEALNASIRSSDTLHRILNSIRSAPDTKRHKDILCAEKVRIRDLSRLYHNAGIYAKLAQQVPQRTSNISETIIDEIAAEAAQVRLLVIFALSCHLIFRKTSCQVNTFRAIQLYGEMTEHLTSIYQENHSGAFPNLTEAV